VNRWLAALGFFWLTATAVMAAPVHPEAGALLVAREGLPDPRFHQAVVLLLEHGPQGTAGLIINRPTRLGLAEALPGLQAVAAVVDPLFYGGPVAPRVFIVLVNTAESPPEPSQKLLDAVYLTGPEPLADWLGTERPRSAYRVFAGYAGWAPEQLASELLRGDWQIVKATEQLVFGADPGGMWSHLSGDEIEPPRH